MYKLHYFPGNASFTPHVLMKELGVPFELVLVDRANNAHKSPEYLKINPAGRIPTLVDGDFVLFETAAIALHLVDTHPEGGLAPAFGSRERAHFYKWLIYMTNTVQTDILMYYYNDRYTTDAEGGEAIKQKMDERLINWFGIIESYLGDGPYFMGEQYTVLDVYLLMLTRWGRYLSKPPRDLEKVGAICRRVLARPVVKEVIETEGISGDFLS